MQIFNFLLASLNSAMSLVLLVVVLIHYVYLDVKPELAQDIPALWLTAFVFGTVGMSSWFCAWARARQHKFKILFEVGNALLGGAGIALLITLYA